jgi:soluble lytic murein transglycosylase
MAQQLATMRTPAAYAGVSAWAHSHTGDAAAAAYLGLGHAYLTDKRYPEASSNLRLVRQNSEVLADYSDFLGAQSEHEQGNDAAAEALLRGFNERYPDTIFEFEAPELEANVLLAQGNASGAQKHWRISRLRQPTFRITNSRWAIAFALGQSRRPNAS